MSTDQIQVPARKAPNDDTIRIPGAAPARSLNYALATEVLTELDPSNKIDRGKLRSIKGRIPRGHALANTIDGWLAEPIPEPSSLASPHRVPWGKNRLRSTGGADDLPDGWVEAVQDKRRVRQADQAEQLTDRDLAWLNSLPEDPAKVTDDDARRLAELSLRYPSGLGEQSTDSVLVDRAFAPVHAHHERLARCSELLDRANVTAQAAATGVRPTVGLPADAWELQARSWAPHLRDLVLAEVPELTEREAEARITEDLTARWSARECAQRQERDAARAELATPEMKQAAGILFAADPSPAA